ncbi:HNH endonuclease [Tardiphaga sp. 839_C3_N1_4]|uniref:HNH endonuclease n=1 Tax=Tardiphaga sp. 839_C3_N1_4 TaxID=3240761 RepID=UPI003F29D368
MPPRPETFETLNIDIPEWKGHNPFCKDKTPKFYQEIKDTAEGKTARTSFFEKNLVGLYWALGRPVPYAFRTKDGTVRSLDAGCVKFLFNRRKPELELIRDVEGYIVAVKPLDLLLDRFRPALNSVTAPYASVAATLDLPFDISSPADERRRVLSEQVRRDGTAGFRNAVYHAWAGRCAISRVSVSQVLEAAHIFPYLGSATNDLRNGILLKSDLHILFDEHLLSLEYVDGALTVRTSKRLSGSPYAKYQDKVITLPHDRIHRPAPAVILQHFENFREAEAIGAIETPPNQIT